MYSEQFTVYSEQFTVYSEQFTLYSVLWTVYTEEGLCNSNWMLQSVVFALFLEVNM